MRHVIPLLVLLLVAAGPMRAQGDPAAAAARAVGGPEAWPGADVVVVYDSTIADVQESGLSSVTMHRLVKVLTDAGTRTLRTVVFDYDPLSADVQVLAARIIRADGTVETLPAARVADYPAPARAICWGARQKLVEVGRLEPGDAVETVALRKGFTYALLAAGDDDSRFIPPMQGHFYDIVEFWSPVPVAEKVYRVFMPQDKPLQFEVYNGELGASVLFPPAATTQHTVEMNPGAAQAQASARRVPTADLPVRPGKTTYTWWKRNMQPLATEPDMVAASDVAPKLLLSTAQDWYAKSVWFHKVNEDFGSFAVTPEVKAMTDSLLRGVTDELARISVLNHWVAEEIRYSGISMGKGEGYTLHPGAMTFLDRCGVCKDKAGMVVTMLRAAGFESYPAMTMAGSRIDRIPADQFNHSVAVVKRKNGAWMLLDPTWIPGVREMWSSAEQQQEFLMGVPGGADLMSTPVSPADNHRWTANATSRLAADGTLEGECTIEAEGQSDAMIRRGLQRSYKAAAEDQLPAQVAALFPLAEVSEVRIGNPADLSAPMTIRFHYRIPRFAMVTDDRIVFTPLLARNPFSDGGNNPEMTMNTSKEKKQHGFRVRCSKLWSIRETVELPAGFAPAALPAFTSTATPVASFRAAYAQSGGAVTLESTHRMEKRIYEAAEWPDFRAALSERKKLADTPVVLERRDAR